MNVSSAITKPIRWDATELPYGRIAYDVDKIGTFTLGWRFCTYSTTDEDMARMTVVYGLAEDDDLTLQGRGGLSPQAPVIHRVEILGANTFDLDDAIATLHGDVYYSSYWLRPHRQMPDGTIVEVSDAARQRIAWIVSRLVEDFLDRDEGGSLTAEHLRHYAATRARTHRHNIANAQAEIADWQKRLALEEANLALQESIADGGPIPEQWPAHPRWRSYRDAHTAEGSDFLLHTVGATKPR